MKASFSVINIVIILGLILLAYLGYTQYLDNKVKQILSDSSDSLQALITPDKPEPAVVTKPPVKNQTPPEKTESQSAQTAETKKIIPPADIKGYYRNNTYFYEINFPPDWPIRIRSTSNVSLGTVPPKNGQGAITIEMSQGENNELEQAKTEAKKYAGLISITEEPIILAGTEGDKITVNNLLAKTKSINILLKKFGFNYLIKYSEESPEFTVKVNRALTTFKFTK